MTIDQVIAAAQTTSNTSVQLLTNGKTEAILTFSTRKMAESVALTLREAGVEKTTITRTPYKEWILVAYWTA